jgi:hypothetical protein
MGPCLNWKNEGFVLGSCAGVGCKIWAPRNGTCRCFNTGTIWGTLLLIWRGDYGLTWRRISICALKHILELDPEAGSCPGNGIHLYCLTRVHATNRVIACSLIYNRNLAYGEGTRLECCDMQHGHHHTGQTLLCAILSACSCRCHICAGWGDVQQWGHRQFD